MRRLIGIIGSIVALVGLFLPAWKYDYGSVLNSVANFFATHFLGTAVLVLAIAGLVVALWGKYAWLWVTGAGSLLLLALAAVIFASGVTEVSSPALFWPWDPGIRPTGMLPGIAVPLAGSVLQVVAASLRRKES